MSPIYLRHGDEFVAMVEQRYEAEDVLQLLLAEHPELLAGSDRETGWVLVKREAGIGDGEGAADRWSLDHLFLDRAGVPTLVEAKRSTDPRARREVVAQMLDYAANATAFWTVERLQGWFTAECDRDGTSPDIVLERTLGVSDPDVSWGTVQTNLAADRIRLVFVADEIAPELAAIVEYLNRQMRETEVIAIEVKQYVDEAGKRQTLVPRVLGRTEAARVAKRAHSHTTIDLTAASPAFQELTAHMDRFANESGLIIKRAATGSNYQPAQPEPGATYATGVGVYATQRGVELNLQVFRDLGRDDLADQLLERLASLTGRTITARSWPAVGCDELASDWELTRRELIEPYFDARAQLTTP